MRITNERIAIVILLLLLICVFFAYIKLEKECSETISRYNRFINVLNIENAQNITPKIEEYIRERVNSTNNSISVEYLTIVNGLYKYNVSLNNSWDFVYTTIDGRYLFIPYINQFNHLTFEVIPLYNTT